MVQVTLTSLESHSHLSLLYRLQVSLEHFMSILEEKQETVPNHFFIPLYFCCQITSSVAEPAAGGSSSEGKFSELIVVVLLKLYCLLEITMYHGFHTSGSTIVICFSQQYL